MPKTMITTNQNFHSSINIAFDLPDDEKVRAFIPTASACRLIEDLFMSVAPNATSRAKMFVGAYGRGKSHIVLMTLALLSRKNPKLFNNFFSCTKALLPEFTTYAKEYVSDSRKLLPVVITGNTADLSQAFLQALLSALKTANLADLMPQTNLQGAITTIEMWRSDYPKTYKKFENLVDNSAEDFIAALKSFDMAAYKEFIEAYPSLTSGGIFNSFAGLNVVDVYEKTIAGLCEHGYNGLYVVYDEFSKYLETNITEATINDVKLLQDFAEKCSRSGDKQMHLLLICHKDIANYIDGKLPKDRVDGWRGVSGRFEHIEIRNGFAQSYELIESSIVKDKKEWALFSAKNKSALHQLEKNAVASKLIDPERAKMVIEGCYPLHPATTFLLPRISEKVAQNERTLFTYLTSAEKDSFSKVYASLDTSRLAFVTPDGLFDYFEPLFRKEAYTSDIHSLYELTARILSRFDGSTLEAKIIKSLMLIYAVAQFECLAPTKEQVAFAFSATAHSPQDVDSAINRLIKEEAVVYLRKSNGYLKLKETSGVDIESEIKRDIERNRGRYSASGILNEVVSSKAIYPSRHNDENEIVRYFQCSFIDSNRYWSIQKDGMCKEDGIDGNIFAILPHDNEDLSEIEKSILDTSKKNTENVFILPRKLWLIEDVIFQYKAAQSLRDSASDDSLLADEYDVLLEDYSEVLSTYNATYFQPEQKMARYFQDGKERKVSRKAQLSALLSHICDTAYPNTPRINNEAINKNELSPAAIHSRTKILVGLCSQMLDVNLGLQGNGQECSIMRSVYAVTGIIENIDVSPKVNLAPEYDHIAYVLETIRSFIYTSDTNKTLQDLYSELTGSAKGIGLKRGLVVLLLAVVLREDWNNLLLKKSGDEQRLTAGVLNDIDYCPGRYYIQPIEWTTEKAEFVRGITELFADFLPDNYSDGDFTQAVDAITRWYLALPRFSKTATQVCTDIFNTRNFSSLSPAYIGLLKALKQPNINPRGFLFDELPQLFEKKQATKTLLDKVKEAKILFDNYVSTTSKTIADDLRNFFDPKAHPDASLVSIITDWSENLDESFNEHVFSGQTNRILGALKSFTSDEDMSLKRLYKAATALRIEDWDERTLQTFATEMSRFKVEVDDFSNSSTSELVSSPQQLAYMNDKGETETRSFQAVHYSQRAKLLRNEIENALEEMGQSIDDSEKRQVLFDVLKDMC